ncbi:MAG TPA: DUF5647 family protein [Chloroflexota bacterium]
MKRGEQITQNLELAGAFLRHLLDHPEDLERISDEASIVIIPSGDPELAQANLALAQQLLEKSQERGEDPLEKTALLVRSPA